MKSSTPGVEKLDRTDRRMIALLQKDGRMPIVNLPRRPPEPA